MNDKSKVDTVWYGKWPGNLCQKFIPFTSYKFYQKGFTRLNNYILSLLCSNWIIKKRGNNHHSVGFKRWKKVNGIFFDKYISVKRSFRQKFVVPLATLPLGNQTDSTYMRFQNFLSSLWDWFKAKAFDFMAVAAGQRCVGAAGILLVLLWLDFRRILVNGAPVCPDSNVCQTCQAVSKNARTASIICLFHVWALKEWGIPHKFPRVFQKILSWSFYDCFWSFHRQLH